MLELVKFVIGQFAEKPELIEYVMDGNEKDGFKITVILDKSDMGKVIGRQGKLAKALRTIVRALCMKNRTRCLVEIQERETVNE